MQLRAVAPFTGAWIEITSTKYNIDTLSVAPFTGAWIEIFNYTDNTTDYTVAPFTGAWIEINFQIVPSIERGSRSLHGGVD